MGAPPMAGGRGAGRGGAIALFWQKMSLERQTRRWTPADEPHFLMRSLKAEFADGQALGAHAHDWHQLIYAVSGVLSVWTGQGAWVVPPQWAVFAPAGVAHAMRFTGRAALRTLYVRPGAWPGLPP